MTLRTMIYPTAILIIGLACLTFANIGYSQGVPMQQNAYLDNRIVLPGGLFYVGGGVRYRNIHKFELRLLERSFLAEDRGVPPFGPSTDGPFGTGVGLPGYPTGTLGYPQQPDTTAAIDDDPRINGIWRYNDGRIDPNIPPNAFTTAVGIGEAAWPSDPPADVSLGRFATGVNLDGADDDTDPRMVGMFSIAVPVTQLNGSTWAGSNTLSFNYVIDGNYNTRFTYDSDGDYTNGDDETPFVSNEEASYSVEPSFAGGPGCGYADKIWTPSIELGIQASNYFDLFYNFSWFDLNHVINRTNTATTQLLRYAFKDEWPFYSDDSSTLDGGSFATNTTQIGDESDRNYRIQPDTAGASGNYPTRTFYRVTDEGADPVQVEESIRYAVNTTAYESRLGGRSWVPLFGLGRIGASAGVQLTPILFEIIIHRTLTTLSAFGPNYPAGTVLDTEDSKNKTWRLNHGAFIGTDLELGLTRFYVKASAEYVYCKEEKINSDVAAVNYNPGGFTATFGGGVRF